MPTKKLSRKVHRYNLVLETRLYDKLTEIAASKGITLVELMRKYIRLGLIVSALEDEPGSKLIIRTDDTEKEIILI
jgi:hypothetical protein